MHELGNLLLLPDGRARLGRRRQRRLRNGRRPVRVRPLRQLTAKTGSFADSNPWRFAGAHNYYYDSGTGLYKVGIRYDDQRVGRWTQRDPIQNPFNPGSWNPYIYVGHDPVNFIDPTGADHLGEIGDILGDVLGLWAGIGAGVACSVLGGQVYFCASIGAGAGYGVNLAFETWWKIEIDDHE